MTNTLFTKPLKDMALKHKNTKKLRPPAAILRALRAVNGSGSVTAFMANFITLPILQRLDKKVFSGNGHPHHPLDGVFMLLPLIPIKNYRSRNDLIEKITGNKRIIQACDLYVGKKQKIQCMLGIH